VAAARLLSLIGWRAARHPRERITWLGERPAEVFGPIIALWVIIAAEMLTDLLMKVGAAPVCTVATGAIGWVLFRKCGAEPHAPQLGSGGT
jgi:hypothetical protein